MKRFRKTLKNPNIYLYFTKTVSTMNTQIFLNGITLEQLAEAVVKLQQQPIAPPQPENEFITRDEVCAL